MTLGRRRMVAYLTRQMQGPLFGDAEVIKFPPTDRYRVATLFPLRAALEDVLDGEEIEEAGGGRRDKMERGVPDDPISLANQWTPSSVGLSFLLEGSELTVHVWGARYEPQVPAAADAVEGPKPKPKPKLSGPWHRIPLASSEDPQVVELEAPHGTLPETSSCEVLDGRARLHVLWRPLEDARRLVTVTLINIAEAPEKGDLERAQRTLFQVGIRCSTALPARIVEYPAPAAYERDWEEEDLALLYRERRVFAVGHGCAAGWVEGTPVEVDEVFVDWMPTFQTPRLVPVVDDVSGVLELGRLAAEEDAARLSDGLKEFIKPYGEWITELESRSGLSPTSAAAHRRTIERLRGMDSRIAAGIDLLRDDSKVNLAFRLANSAVRSAILRESVRQGSPRARNEVDPVSIGSDREEPRWYPFQLAFQLSVLPSLVDPGHPERDLVDLLWFPTGGGKTEAYLGLAAFAIIHRRLTGGDPGPTVLTRYTLRLLTTQQFQRTATLVCALESIRRDRDDLGVAPIRLGLWIGEDRGTPNTLVRAKEAVERIREVGAESSPFQIDRCPWCATALIPKTQRAEEADHGFVLDGTNGFSIRCPTDTCLFHEQLPIEVVDELLYAAPPDFVVATVDKFAGLPWNENAGRILGGRDIAGPSLIIQDELHLLTGPLGTMVGLYELSVERLSGAGGSSPKIIASTATIRRAEEQVSGLFGRGVSAFPPSGLEFGESYFAVEEDGGPDAHGRIYVGLMLQAQTSLYAVIQGVAALLQGEQDVEELTDAERDGFSTLVAYHGSLREHGATMAATRDDIPERMKVYARSDETEERLIDPDAIEELTSSVSGEQLVGILNRLSLPRGHPEAIAFLGVTNMFSVGVDVTRLGLMLVKSQPKSTSEYIQATSRVGRGRNPGLVLVVYSPSRARDRSYYEQFRSFHQSLYRWVEPMSVTPFALPARNRALHAVLVSVLRHEMGLTANSAAAQFDSASPAFRRARELILDRVRNIDVDEAESTGRQLDVLEIDWSERVAQAASDGKRLHYSSGRNAAVPALLKDFHTAGVGWETLRSLRNVDVEVALRYLDREEHEKESMRRSQVISPFGPGSIMDLGDRGSFMVLGTDRWQQQHRLERIPMARLAAETGTAEFRIQPQRSESGPSIPLLRFPQWLFCESKGCRRMSRWNETLERDRATTDPRCSHCRGNLRPMRYVVICGAGHLSDVDWPRWAHSRSDGTCRSTDLRYVSVATEGPPLQWLRVQCRHCRSERDLADILVTGALKHQAQVSCEGGQPAQRQRVSCPEETQVIPKGASRVHFANVRSAIDIPPDSDIDDDGGVTGHPSFPMLVGQVAGHLEEGSSVDVSKNVVVKAIAEMIAESTGQDVASIIRMARQDSGAVPALRPEGESAVLLEEWLAFQRPHPESSPGARFITHAEKLDGSVSEALTQLVPSVLVADRLREVRAFTSFSRLVPGGTAHPPYFDAHRSWLPAIETYGEGIFLRISEERLKNWEAEAGVQDRVRSLEQRRIESSLSRTLLPEAASPRFVLLHTLSHLLMRQLSFDCGYSPASIRERLYSSTDDARPMSGILLYTSAGDSEGTLGGLAREGSTSRLAGSLAAALRNALWCSVDPICIESASQGTDGLNRGACHGCCLAPETSCTHVNSLLDRALVVGTPTEPSLGFFAHVLNDLSLARMKP